MANEAGMASIREAFGKALLELGSEAKNIVVVGADTTESIRSSLFGDRFPERFFNVGIAEQNMIGVAAGLALAGKTVFCGTYVTFMERAIDQIRNAIAYCNLDVKIAGAHAGLSTGPDGATHQAIEDISIMRALPNVRVVAPSDYYSTHTLTKQLAGIRGPFYLRLVRPEVPKVYNGNEEMEIGKMNTIVDGSDVTIISNGVMVSRAVSAAGRLKSAGISVRVADCHTIKPIDESYIVDAARGTGRIITAEDHNVIGGLGSAVAEVLSRRRPTEVRMVGVRDVFGESGKPDELMEKYGLSVDAIVNEATAMVKG